ncbi:hypothetical protein BB561_003010 [Smittium simulii]|uniref:FAD-binding FR-type domain-containing protein n=1 Tax=Smittium simulii TaxID=133385 RepID=A0A2T9YNB8_9FUNG|nr:hypothetical protein BB561_003010 [Smittium simulii]
MLGASPITELGLGDDQHYLGVNGMFDQWSALFFEKAEKLNLILNLNNNNQSSNKFLIHYSFIIKKISIDSQYQQTPANWKQNVAKVTENAILTSPEYNKKVIKVSLDLGNLSPYESFAPGDFISVAPENSLESTDQFLLLLGLLDQKDCLFSIKKTSFSDVFDNDKSGIYTENEQSVKTLFEIVRTMLDINSIPKRLFFKYASCFSNLEFEREKLEELGSPEGLDLYYSYIIVPKRTVLETIADFPSLCGNVPVACLLDMFSRIYKKSYSISNYDPDGKQVSLTVAVVSYRKNARMPLRLGTCSNYLLGVEKGSLVTYDLHRGSMTLPPYKGYGHSSTPIIMVGPGTGLAPFMSFLQYRILNGSYNNTLFFGCRSETKDFIYKSDLHELVIKSHLKLFTAFSRDSPNVVYVQNVILEQYKLVADLICNKNAFVYVSGRLGQMPVDVQNAFAEAITKAGVMGMDITQSQNYLIAMKKTGRYQQECWD